MSSEFILGCIVGYTAGILLGALRDWLRKRTRELGIEEKDDGEMSKWNEVLELRKEYEAYREDAEARLRTMAQALSLAVSLKERLLEELDEERKAR